MNLSTKLAEKLANALGYNDEQRAVLAYGLGAAIQMLELFIIALVFGLVFDCAYESIILFLGVGFLRRSCGGTHCTTYMACILTSSLSICLLAFVCRYLLPGYLPNWVYILAGMVPGFGCAFAFAWKRVPQDSPAKPITNPAKIARLRRQCFTTLLVYLLIASLLLAFDWGDGRNISSFCAVICVLYWQCFTLTKWSTRLAQAMDLLFSNDNT